MLSLLSTVGHDCRMYVIALAMTHYYKHAGSLILNHTQDFEAELPTISTTLRTTAILEAGRRSLDANSQAMTILYNDIRERCRPTGIEPFAP